MNQKIERWRKNRIKHIKERSGRFEVLSDAYLARFQGIDSYSYQEELRIPAKIHVAVGDTAELERKHSAGKLQKYENVARITFQLGGVEYTSVALEEGSGYLLTFQDATVQELAVPANYSPRFLYLTPAAPASEIILDFNMAYLPQCAFSDKFNCPLPPPENRFATPIHAGERAVIFKDGTPDQERVPDSSLTSCS